MPATTTTETPQGETMKIAEVARRLHCCTATVRRLIDDKVLPSFRLPGGPRKVLRVDVESLAVTFGVPDGNGPLNPKVG